MGRDFFTSRPYLSMYRKNRPLTAKKFSARLRRFSVCATLAMQLKSPTTLHSASEPARGQTITPNKNYSRRISIANSAISGEFGFSKAQIGHIITTALLAYACGQIINGLLTDRLGGRRAMLIGAAGTVVMNILFGVASFWGLLWLFVVIRGIDGYMQAFGAPGMVKINAAWFRHTERGGFAGIFGFMINLGRFGIFKLGPALLAGFTFLGLIQIPPLHWRWLFWIPAGIAILVGICMALIVKDTPEEANFPPVNPEEETGGSVQVKVFDVFKIIVTNPVIWVVACAYACTGAVRQGIDQWFPRFLQDV